MQDIMTSVDTHAFPHAQSAHCESGVTSSLLNHHGLSLSEPMIFGIGSGLFFAHLPFVKVNGIPGTAYRIMPGLIFKRASKRLGLDIHVEKFSNPDKGMDALNRTLDKGIPVGMLTSIFYLPYMPSTYRFHFNAHNIIVFGRKGNTYYVSDPVLETTSEIDAEDLRKARFAKGFPAPSGKMYYPANVPQQVNLKDPIKWGIAQTAKDMLTIPIPLFGVKGIRYLAGKVAAYPEKVGEKYSILYLGNIIRMQEEIGTGGAGFRFIFAAFLKEAYKHNKIEELLPLSEEMTKTGDLWRTFAYNAGRVCKSRTANEMSFRELGDIMLECADREEKIYRKLREIRF